MRVQSTGTLWHPLCKEIASKWNIIIIMLFQDLNPGSSNPTAQLVLSVISYVGVVISLVCLTFLVISYLTSKYVFTITSEAKLLPFL